jgi:hypothetical protein
MWLSVSQPNKSIRYPPIYYFLTDRHPDGFNSSSRTFQAMSKPRHPENPHLYIST